MQGFADRVKDAMSNPPVHTECMEQFTDVMSDHLTWPYMFNRLKSPYQRLLYVKQNYPYVVSWKLFKNFVNMHRLVAYCVCDPAGTHLQGDRL